MCFWYSDQNWTAFDRCNCCNQNGIRYGRKPLITSQAGVDSVIDSVCFHQPMGLWVLSPHQCHDIIPKSTVAKYNYLLRLIMYYLG